MKIISKSLVGMSFVLLCSSAMAETVNVKGTPVMLVPYKQIYQLPQGYSLANNNYLYATIGGSNNVCYTQPNSNLTSLQMTIVTLYINGQYQDWNCYTTGTANSSVVPNGQY